MDAPEKSNTTFNIYVYPFTQHQCPGAWPSDPCYIVHTPLHFYPPKWSRRPRIHCALCHLTKNRGRQEELLSFINSIFHPIFNVLHVFYVKPLSGRTLCSNSFLQVLFYQTQSQLSRTKVIKTPRDFRKHLLFKRCGTSGLVSDNRELKTLVKTSKCLCPFHLGLRLSTNHSLHFICLNQKGAVGHRCTEVCSCVTIS